MTTRDIRTSTPITGCDVCGRTLLRGEREHIYLDGGARRSVCELCTARALQEGWVREGAMPEYEGGRGASDRRRSLFGRLRGRRERPPESAVAPSDRPSRLDRLRSRDIAAAQEQGAEAWEDDEVVAAPAPSPSRRRPRESAREPRHVRAIPSSAEQKFAAAIDVFNGSEHRRTVAGVARSLGMPTVAVQPGQSSPGLVIVVVSWELCWYRYEIDLSDGDPNVQVVAQGYELDELEEADRRPNAVADEQGALSLSV